MAKELATQTNAQVVPFSTVEKVDGAYLENGGLYFKGELLMHADELGVPGSHNVENALATIAVANCQVFQTRQLKKLSQDLVGLNTVFNLLIRLMM